MKKVIKMTQEKDLKLQEIDALMVLIHARLNEIQLGSFHIDEPMDLEVLVVKLMTIKGML